MQLIPWGLVSTSVLVLGLSGASCAVVSPGERGVKRTLGHLSPEIHNPGVVFYNPFVTSVVRLPVRTTNVEVKLALPSREGLTVHSEISILYRVMPDQIPAILEKIGPRYESTLILTTFRSKAADITSRHFAKDMHSSERSNIEGEIAAAMNKALKPWGFQVEGVLLKSIVLPERLSTAIEQKLKAEQEAQRMEFVLKRETLEAERRVTEATGIRDAQQIIDQGLTPMLLKWRTIEAFKELANSPNAKVIFTDGKSPLLIPPFDEEKLAPSSHSQSSPNPNY